MSRVEALPAENKAIDLGEAAGHGLEDLSSAVRFEQENAVVVQRLLADMGRAGLDGQRVMKLEVELERVDDLGVGQVVHLFEDVQAHHQANGLVGATVALVKTPPEQLLVDQRQHDDAKGVRPGRCRLAGGRRNWLSSIDIWPEVFLNMHLSDKAVSSGHEEITCSHTSGHRERGRRWRDHGLFTSGSSIELWIHGICAVNYRRKVIGQEHRKDAPNEGPSLLKGLEHRVSIE